MCARAFSTRIWPRPRPIAAPFAATVPAPLLSKRSEGASMAYEDVMALLGDWLLPGSLVAIMASMGLSLTADDFKQVFRNKRALVFGVCSMLVVPPLIGVTMALTVAPTAALA